MAFWGIEIKSGRPYTHRYDENQGRLHLSLATLGSGSSAKKSIVQCTVGDKKPINLCALVPERIETCPLNLEFEEFDEVIFSVTGPHSIHLSGFFLRESQDGVGDDYDDSYADTSTDASTDYNTDSTEDDYGYNSDSAEDDYHYNSDSTEDYSEDDYRYNFFDDDVHLYSPSHVPNSGVIIEEILDDEKPAGNVNSQQQIVTRGTSVPVLEGEDGFPSASRKTKASVKKTKVKTEKGTDKRTEEKAKRKKAIDDSEHVKSLKRKVDAVIQDGESRLTGHLFNSSPGTSEVVPEVDVKQKKRKKKKKKNESGNDRKSRESHTVEATTKDMDPVPPIGVERNEQQSVEKSRGIGDENHSNGKKKRRQKKKRNKSRNKSS